MADKNSSGGSRAILSPGDAEDDNAGATTTNRGPPPPATTIGTGKSQGELLLQLVLLLPTICQWMQQRCSTTSNTAATAASLLGKG
jgi:hypothetical protein